MDFNRLTEKAQEAVRSAQSIATRYGNQQMDVEHLLAALLEQADGLAPAILIKAGVNVEGLHRRTVQDIERLPKVSGASGAADQVYVTAPSQPPAHPGRGRSAQAQGRVHLDRAPAARHDRRRRLDGPGVQGIRRHARAAPHGSSGSPRQPAGDLAESRGDLPGPGALRPRPHPTGRAGQARPGHRPRRRDPPRHPGPVAAHQEQPGADRRAGRGQDRHRRGAGPAHRARRRARGPEEQAAWSPSTWARSSPARSSAASSRSA